MALVNKFNNIHKLIGLSAVGSCFELFDFLSFLFLSSFLSKVFFPGQGATQGLLYTFVIFATGYFFRPIGGIILAHFGDKYGRKRIFVLTLLLMSLPSLLIAILPGAQQIGYCAPILLALLRMTQGISVGGEVAGSTTYIAEFTPEKWRALACSLNTTASTIGVLLVTLIISLLTHYLSEQQMLSFGWRIPFLIGAILGIIAVYLRKQFSETPLFIAVQSTQTVKQIPLLHLLKKYRGNVLFGMCLSILIANSTSTFHLFFPTFLADFMHHPQKDVFLISALGTAISTIITPLFALLSMYLGRKRQCFIGAVSILVICLVAAKYQFGTKTLFEAYLFVGIVSLAIGLVNSVLMVTLAESFPTSVRFSGIATSYNIGCLIGAGFTPMLNTYFIHMTGYLYTPFILVAVAAVIAMSGIILKSSTVIENNLPVRDSI